MKLLTLLQRRRHCFWLFKRHTAQVIICLTSRKAEKTPFSQNIIKDITQYFQVTRWLSIGTDQDADKKDVNSSMTLLNCSMHSSYYAALT